MSSMIVTSLEVKMSQAAAVLKFGLVVAAGVLAACGAHGATTIASAGRYTLRVHGQAIRPLTPTSTIDDYLSRGGTPRPQAMSGYSTLSPTVSSAYTLGAPYSSYADNPNNPDYQPANYALKNLAENLNNDPTRIYEWVRNNVRSEFYIGAVRGAYLTFLERAGNDVDQAALLGALLKAAGYTPTYRCSYIWIPLTATGANTVGAYDWLGVGDSASAVSSLANFSASIDTNGMLRLQAMWVEATVQNQEVIYFPWVKPYAIGRKPDLDSLSGYAFADAATAANATVTGSQSPAISSSSLRAYLTARETQAAGSIHGSGSYHDLTGAELARVPTIVPEVVTVTAPGATRYPAGLLHNDDSVTTALSGIPTSMETTLTLTVGAYSTTLEAPQLMGRALDIEFDGAGDAIVRLAGTEIGRDTSGTSSDSVTTTIGYTDPDAYYNGSPRTLSYPITVPRQNAIAIPYGFGTAVPRLQLTLGAVSAKEVASPSNVTLTDRLEIVGQQYVAQCDELGKIGANYLDHRFDRFVQMGFVREIGGTPVLDIGINSFNLSARSSSAPTTMAVYRVVDTTSGALEGTSIQQMSGAKAFGTPGLFDYAMGLGRSAYLVTSSAQLTQIEPSLSNFNDATLGANAVEQIQSDLSHGEQIMILSDSSVPYGGQTFGAYYRITSTGVGSMIAGAAGGVTSSPIGSNSVLQPTNADQTTPTNATPNTQIQTSSDPVDLTNGAFLVHNNDLDVGGDGPTGLHLERSYNSARRLDDSSGLGRGWTHSYIMQVVMRSPNDLDVSRASVDEVLPALLAMRLAEDAINTEASARVWLMAGTALAWAGDQQISTRASVMLGDRTMEYVVAPDGTFAAPPGVTAALSKATDGTYSLKFRHGNTIEFGKAISSTSAATVWKFTSISDEFNNTLSAAYDGSNRLHTVTDAYNRVFTFDYDSNGRLFEVDDSTGRKVLYGRDTNNNFTYTDPDSDVQTYDWDANFLITSVIDGRNRTVIENDYDYWDRVWQQRVFGDANRVNTIWIAPGVGAEVDPAGNATWTYFDTRGRKIAQLCPAFPLSDPPFPSGDLRNYFTTWQYDGADRLIQVATPRAAAAGKPTRFTYDEYDVLTSETNSVGMRTITSDSGHRPWQVSNFEGKITTYTYTSQDKVQTITAPGGIETDFYYDSYGRVHTEHPAAYSANSLKTYDYDLYGGLQKITYPDATFDQYTCSAAGDVTQVIDRNNVKTTYGYNGRRMRTSVSKWQGTTELKAQTDYDAAGDESDFIDASNRRTDYDHDALGNLLTVKQGPTGAQITTVTNQYFPDRVLLHTSTDALNHTTTYGYDAPGHRTNVVDALTHETQQSYDVDGNAETVTTALNFQTKTTYTLTGWVDYFTDAESGLVDYQYDKDGRKSALGNRLSQTFTWTYDDDARTVTQNTPLSRTTVTSRSTRGLLASIQKPSDAANAPSVMFDQYDDEGRLTQKTDGVGTTTYSYWPNGLPEDVAEGGHTSHRVYDEANRLKEYDDGEGNVFLYEYFPSGELKKLTYPDQRVVTYEYDDFGRMHHVYDGNRTTTYTYDDGGRLTRVDRPNGTYRVQVFDAANRLMTVEEHFHSGEIFFYENLTLDNDGRITAQAMYPKAPAYAFPIDALTYDDDNELLTWNSQSPVFDLNGNMTTGPLPSGVFGNYTYDARNRLTAAGGSSYVYNPDGLRVAITGTGAATFAVDPNAGLSRVLTRVKNGATTDYVYGLGLLYEEAGSAAKQYHFDHIGNTMALTDDGGAVSDRWTYSSFGTITSRSGSSDTLFEFNGEVGVQSDVNGLIYMRARYFNPRVMRFLNADPIQFDGGLNWYTFAYDEPLQKSDPSGLKVQFDSSMSAADVNAIISINAATMGSSVHQSNWSALVNSPMTFTVTTFLAPAIGSTASFTPGSFGGTIKIDPTLVPTVYSTGKPMTPEQVWGHEVSHAAKYAQDTTAYDDGTRSTRVATDPNTGDMIRVSKEEDRAMADEKKISDELHIENQRKSYEDTGVNAHPCRL